MAKMSSTPTAAKVNDSETVSAFVNALPVSVNDIHISGNERTYNDFIERELQPIRHATTAGQLAGRALEAVAVSLLTHSFIQPESSDSAHECCYFLPVTQWHCRLVPALC